MTRPIVFSDLDDTVFQTARKMAAAPDPRHLASHALNDSHSYMTGNQALMMDWLLASTRFIPVTARSTEALSRCRLPFRDHRICTNGAIILLPDGSPDPDWCAQTAQQAKAAAPALNTLLAFVTEQTDPGRYRCWIVEEYGTGFYFCVKSNTGAEVLDAVDAPLTAIAGDAFTRHRNDNNLSFTPAGISKRHAVTYLARKLVVEGAVPLLGMGDSLTDLPFMAACDMMIVPTGSQIDRELLRLGAMP